jgi:hypothetical protein
MMALVVLGPKLFLRVVTMCFDGFKKMLIINAAREKAAVVGR